MTSVRVNNKKNKIQQISQEEQYIFPYHYIDLSQELKLFQDISYLSYLKIIKELLSPFKGQIILDAGCGDGRLCYELKRENVIIIGVDYSEKAINFAKAFSPNVEFQLQDLRNLKFLDKKFDQIVLMEVIEHIPPEEVSIVIKNLSRILKDDGILIISTPTNNLRIPDKHFQHFDKYQLREVLSPYFKIVKEIGHDRHNFSNRIIYYILIKIVRMFLCPIRGKVNIINSFNAFLSNYYKKNLEICKPDEALRLIVTCRKVTKNL